MPATVGDTYVIRIYRRATGDPPQPIGMVEHVRSGKKLPFHTMDELWRVLMRRARKSATPTRRA
jgi:hypothetical protein